ncbi:MAG: hypothetical protein ACFFCP_18255, partial [Promethearchaeota archaeon]
MQNAKYRGINLVLMLLLVFSISCFSALTPADLGSVDRPLLLDPRSDSFNQESERFVSPNTQFPHIWTLSETHSLVPASGAIDPILVEQTGYSGTGNVSARTDTRTETTQDLEIDTTHNWVASKAEVDVWNLERMYVVNGTFSEGIPGYTINPNGTLDAYPYGWTAWCNNTDPDQMQRVSYDDGGRQFVSVHNQAEVSNNPQHEYTHYAGTKVLWNQTIDISPYSENFFLSFDYLYFQGPLTSLFSGDFSLKVFLDNTAVYSIDVPSLSERGTWFSTGQIPINLAVLSNITTFSIGLVIDNTFLADGDDDYDLDTFPDGTINTQYITLYIDDVSLIAASPPDPESVALEFSINGSTASLIGSDGSGFGQIANQSYWDESSLGFSITSNTSVSFNYNAKLLNHRFLNSSWTTDILKPGVAFNIESGKSGNLEMYTYLGFLGSYDELTLHLHHPRDWKNITVLDPFLSDVTTSCALDTVSITIPEFLLDRLGWWKITCDAPNYAYSAEVERYDSGLPGW